MLAADASAALRDQLLAEMANVTDPEQLLRWAHRSLPAKNKLTGTDARLVEEAFESKLNALPGEQEPTTESAVLNSTQSEAAGICATATAKNVADEKQSPAKVTIPRSRHDPKIPGRYDAKVVGD
jgi:hypothetical protein